MRITLGHALIGVTQQGLARGGAAPNPVKIGREGVAQGVEIYAPLEEGLFLL
jgi:hypothetical protein